MLLSTIAAPVLLLLSAVVDAKPVQKRDSPVTIFTVPTLPYDAGALAPVISAATNEAHLKILAGAVSALNAQSTALIAAADKGDLEGIIEAATLVLKTSAALDLHEIYFNSLAPVSQGGGNTSKASSALSSQIQKDFGGFNNLFKILTAKTATLQASGWGFLVWDLKNLVLDVITTDNEAIPPSDFVILLDVDFFEHAFYLDYEDKSAEYLGNITSIFNWQYASSAFQNATSDSRAFISKRDSPVIFTVPTLPYDAGALAPHISKETNLAHLDILTGAVGALNTNIQAFITAVGKGDVVGVNTASQVLLKVAGALLNHELYFDGLAPVSSGGGDTSKASSAFSAQVTKDFGSFATLQQALFNATATLPASGWAFLVWDTLNKALDVVTTNNEDIPPATLIPLLNIDFFEHAYFLDYQQVTASYLSNLTAIFNWQFVSQGFEKACNQSWSSAKGSLADAAADVAVGSASSSGPSTGVIIAAVVGGLAAAGIVAAGVIAFLRRRNSKGRYGAVGKPQTGFPIVNAEETHHFVREPLDDEKSALETVEYRDPYSDHHH